MNETLLRMTDRGLYCERGDFFVDPWVGVDRAIVTHAHGDHACPYSRSYLAASDGERVLRTRLGFDAPIRVARYGERIALNGSTRAGLRNRVRRNRALDAAQVGRRRSLPAHLALARRQARRRRGHARDTDGAASRGRLGFLISGRGRLIAQLRIGSADPCGELAESRGCQ